MILIRIDIDIKRKNKYNTGYSNNFPHDTINQRHYNLSREGDLNLFLIECIVP